MKLRGHLALAFAFSLCLVSAVIAEDEHDHHESEEHATPSDTDQHDEHDDHGDEHGEGGDHEEDGHDEHGLVRLSSAELTEFGMQLESAGPGVIETALELPGEVKPNADRLAHIVPRYSGIVTEVRARIGDYVNKGQVLAIIESDESLAPFEVKTLISGTIIGKHITLGEAASRDRDAFVIADLSTVWIDLTVYQRDLRTVKVGQAAQVYVGHDLAHDSGTISYITPVVDEHTRTATARLVLSNKNKLWRPGMFVTASVVLQSSEVPLAVPHTALQTVEDNFVVFIETEEGFTPQPVSLGRRGKTHVEVLSGLSAGDRYVAINGFTLKAELEKEAFGDGHGH